MALANPPYAALVSKLPRLRFITVHVPLLPGQPADLLRAAARDGRGATDLDRPRLLHLDVGLQPLRRLGLLGVPRRRVHARAGHAAVRLHRGRRDGRRDERRRRSRPRSCRCSARRPCCWSRSCCSRWRCSRCARLSGIATALKTEDRRDRGGGLAHRRQHDGGPVARRQQPVPAQREPVHAALHDHVDHPLLPAGRHRGALVHRPRGAHGVLRAHRPRGQRAHARHAGVPDEPDPEGARRRPHARRCCRC